MSLLDLVKATILFGVVAFMIYSYPVLGQGMVIGLLGLLWLCYARKAILTIRRKWLA